MSPQRQTEDKANSCRAQKPLASGIILWPGARTRGQSQSRHSLKFAIRANEGAFCTSEISWSNLLSNGEETQSHSNSPNTIQCAPFSTTEQQNTCTVQECPRGRHFPKHIKDQAGGRAGLVLPLAHAFGHSRRGSTQTTAIHRPLPLRPHTHQASHPHMAVPHSSFLLQDHVVPCTREASGKSH